MAKTTKIVYEKKRTRWGTIMFREEVLIEFKRRADDSGMDYSTYLQFLLNSDIPVVMDAVKKLITNASAKINAHDGMMERGGIKTGW